MLSAPQGTIALTRWRNVRRALSEEVLVLGNSNPWPSWLPYGGALASGPFHVELHGRVAETGVWLRWEHREEELWLIYTSTTRLREWTSDAVQVHPDGRVTCVKDHDGPVTFQPAPELEYLPFIRDILDAGLDLDVTSWEVRPQELPTPDRDAAGPVGSKPVSTEPPTTDPLRDPVAWLDWAGAYNAYDRLAGTPRALAAVLAPARNEYQDSRGVVPEWAGVDLLRGWLFLLYREDRFTSGSLFRDSDDPATQEWRRVYAAWEAKTQPTTTGLTDR